MKRGIRRIGNSLELSGRGPRPAASAGLSHQALDELKRSIALAVVRRFTVREIRAQILANLHRWKRQGAWVSAYDEWSGIAQRDDDGELFAAMLGRDDNAVRLRQSMPFVGLLSREDVRLLHEQAARPARKRQDRGREAVCDQPTAKTHR